MPDNQPLVEQAVLTPQARDDLEAVTVHFNPASLKYVVSNSLDNSGKDNKSKQFVSQTTAKLSMELVFDTTVSGEDVRRHTDKVSAMLKPEEEGGKKVAAVIKFEWGTYSFMGMIEGYNETLEFFAPGGIPLRAALSLTLSQQDEVFEPSAYAPNVDTQAPEDPFQFPTAPNQPGGASEAASQAGDPRAARDIGAANGAESLRFGDGNPIGVQAIPASARPAPALDGVAGPAKRSAKQVDPRRLLRRAGSESLASDSGATFNQGGRAMVHDSGSQTADTGANADLMQRIQFDQEA